ncbi:cytochrome P450 [Pisolithus marmoratus]|nr:cytochrome P450 [Pisolithus marmoratus]
MILAYLSPIPVAIVCGDFYSHLHDRREAVHWGTVLAPQVKSSWPGGINILLSVTRDFCKEHIEYGPTMNITTMLEDWIFSAAAEHIKEILATQFNSFEKGTFPPIFQSGYLGPTKCSAWNWSIQLGRYTSPVFSNSTHAEVFTRFGMQAKYGSSIARWRDHSLARIGVVTSIDALNQAKARLQEGFPVDFQDMVYRFALDSAAEYLFGKSVRSLSAGLVIQRIRYQGKTGTIQFTQPTSSPMHFRKRNLKLCSAEFWNDRIRGEVEVCHGFIDPIIKDALEKDDEGGWSIHRTDLTVIRDEILNILIAGRDTTASALTSLIYMLSQHPDIPKRSRRPTYDDVREMKYMRAVINETLRLYPPVPFNIRLDSIAEGLNIDKHRSCSVARSGIFDLDRFLDERLKYPTSNPFIFLPFNAGPRICLGQQFSYNEISFFVVCLLQTLSSLTLAEGVQTRPAKGAKGTGCNSQEKVIFRRHLTLYVDVSTGYPGFI